MSHDLVQFTDEVGEALDSGGPVVALESTIISHGMPYPRNVEMALEVEQIVRDNGAVPATIAILNGRLHAGLDAQQLDLLASDPAVTKASIRDLPYLVATGRHGATTVAATMRIANLAGIRTFVTGGLGGVHRGAERSMDISADLTEMSLTDMAIVSAGVKSLLDIGLTLEVLETLGVPVVTYGADEFPSFYSRSSGYASPMRLDSAVDIAATMRAKWDLGLRGAISVANPVPVADEIPADEIGKVIDQAIIDAEAAGVRGKDITPYLLGHIVELTDGASLETNIALVRNNARLGAEIAVAYAAT